MNNKNTYYKIKNKRQGFELTNVAQEPDIHEDSKNIEIYEY